MPLLFNLYMILCISRVPGSCWAKGCTNPEMEGFLHLVNQSGLVACTSAPFQCGTNIYRVAPATTTRSVSSGPQEFPCRGSCLKHWMGAILYRWFNKHYVGEGTDLAETSPFSEEQVEELRCSTHPAALCRGDPSGRLGPKEAPPWVRGKVLPRHGILLHGLLGNAGKSAGEQLPSSL